MVRRIIRLVTRLGYQHGAKPLLFRQKPDIVHRRLVRVAKRVQRVPLVKAMPRVWSHQDEDVLAQEIAGIRFRNPVGLSAGFDKKLELPGLMKAVGFGWITGGSVTLGAYKGNNGDWYYRLPKTKSIVVNAGLPSEGTKIVSKRVQGYDAKLFDDFPLNVSVAKTNSKKAATDKEAIADYTTSLATFDKLPQVKMLEINISCPNTFGGEPFTDAPRLDQLLRAVDALKLKKPVFVKMPINLPLEEFDALLATITKHAVTGVVIGNLFKDRAKAELKDTLPEEVKGNLSGVPMRKTTTELVRRTYKQYGTRLVIVGVGGIMSAQDAYEKIRAGASLVALISGLMFEGPQLIGAINDGLVQRIKKDGFRSVSEVIGLDAK